MTDRLPITVIVPRQSSREEFFRHAVLPAIRRNHPAQLVVVDREGDVNSKRNEGAAQATQPYLFFCDDNCIVMDDCLEAMLQVLEDHPDAAFVYSDFKRAIHEGASCPYPAGVQEAGVWTTDKLRTHNFVDTASLMRREAFPGFDPAIKKFQAWDLWLSVLDQGGVGTYISQTLFELHYMDTSVSNVESHIKWRNAVLRKHGIYGKDVWPTVSFLVGTTGEEGFQSALESFLPHLTIGDEGIVLSNGPIPEVQEALKAAPHWVTLHEMPKHNSFEWEHRNEGMKLAKSEYVVFLDDRSILLNGAVPAIRRAIVRNPGKAFLFKVERGSFILPREGNLWHGAPIPSAFVLPNDRSRWPRWTEEPKEFIDKLADNDVMPQGEVIARCLNGEA